jgi:hypothetical protein
LPGSRLVELVVCGFGVRAWPGLHRWARMIAVRIWGHSICTLRSGELCLSGDA